MFPSGYTILYPQSSVWEFQFLHILSNIWYGPSWILAILTDV